MDAQSDLASAFRAWWASAQSTHIVEDLAALSGLDVDDVRVRLSTGASEALYSLSFLGPHLSLGRRILEVGAGTGVLGAFLTTKGYDIYLLEPGAEGFEAFRALCTGIADRFGVDRRRLLPYAIEDLSASRDGTFDLIYSNNVLEHVTDFDDCVSRLTRVLEPTGLMIHSCPNYLVPYEPHFGLPLVPLAPRMTAMFLPSRVTDTVTWRTLNFVTTVSVERAARRIGGRVRFHTDALAAALHRLGTDQEFRSRHHRLAQLSHLINRSGTLWLLRRMPYHLATPMVFEWRPATR